MKALPIFLIALGTTLLPAAIAQHEFFGIMIGIIDLGLGFHLLMKDIDDEDE